MVHQQQTTFAPLVPGIIRIVPTASRKKQRIDLRAVRANRGERRSKGAAVQQPRQSTGSGSKADKVGQKRRRDDDDEEEQQQQQGDEEEDEEQRDGDGGGAGEDGDGDVAVDESGATSAEEVATSGAEGDIESAAELDGDTTSVET